METQEIKIAEIIVTTGIYDLIKEHVRRKRVTNEQEQVLLNRLKFAKQLRRVEIPNDVVDIDTIVQVKNLATNQINTYKFVAPSKAKQKRQTLSILGEIGIIFIGCKQGAVIQWPNGNEIQEFEIIAIEPLQ